MMPVFIEESGMKFGPFKDENIFHIERSDIYKQLQHGLQMAEFLLFRPEKKDLLILEAKTSAPNPNSCNMENEKQIDDRQKRFEEYITEIHEKLLNALTLAINLYLDRHENGKSELPQNIRNIKFDNVEIRLLLVIKNHKKVWLKDIQDKLQQKLRSATKTWRCTVTAINEEEARRFKLIQ